jgi:phosphoglycolate phosphatase-like HAD superfamily hydrolase
VIFLFDLDGTLCDGAHRMHYIQGDKKDWNAFFAAANEDLPIFETITIARALFKNNTILLSTGRSESIRQLTADWMVKYRVPYQGLWMRKVNDHRPDTIVKSELLDDILKRYPKVDGVFEDRASVVEMYRARGLRVYQVAQGDF